MDLRKIRSILAITMIGFFLIITGVLALLPLFSGNTEFSLEGYINYFSKIANIYTGFIGVILGYYFGRSVEQPGKEKEAIDEKSA